MPDGSPLGAPDAPADGAPEGAPDGAPEAAPFGTPDGAPLGTPDGAWQDCRCPESPLFEVDEESPEPQATRARGESASRAAAGRRRTRFMRNNSKKAEGILRRALNQRRMGAT